MVMGMRANEIVSRVVRDLDDDGRLLWIPDSKTVGEAATSAELNFPRATMARILAGLPVREGTRALLEQRLAVLAGKDSNG